MDVRYQKNVGLHFSEKLQNNLLTKNIAVIGCGGIGGYLLEYLCRLGVCSITYWDGDIFSESNLNRQIYCTKNTIGQNKAKVATKNLQNINSTIALNEKQWFFGDKDEDLNDILKCDIIFLAADYYYNIIILRTLIREIIEYGIPVIDCPITPIGGYVKLETKLDLSHFDQNTNRAYYQSLNINNLTFSQPAYKCALIAAEAVNQMVLYFSNPMEPDIDKRIDINIYNHNYYISK